MSSDAHQKQHGKAQPVGAEVAGHQPREDVQRGAALARAGPISRTGAELVEVKTFTKLGNQGARQSAATDYGGKLPPQELSAARSGIICELTTYGQADGRIEVSHTSVVRGASKFILAELPNRAWRWPRSRSSRCRSDHHHHAHGEDPDRSCTCTSGCHGRQDEGINATPVTP